MPKLLVTGTRWGRPDVERMLDAWVERFGPPSLVISGRASHPLGGKSVDIQAEEWAARRGFPVRAVPVTPDEWKDFGGAAGHFRNQTMVDLCELGDHCFAFPAPGRSPGTRHCIGAAKKAKLIVHVAEEGRPLKTYYPAAA